MTRLHLEDWDERGFALLIRQNAPELKEHLGGPETEEQVRDRHQRYLDPAVQMFLVTLDDEVVGSVGYWEREWNGEPVYETGYGILPEHGGRGFAVEALGLCAARAARDGDRDWLHAYPSIDHAASNAVCRKAGFELAGECAFEYPPGHPMLSNDWRLRLSPAAP